MVEMKRKIHKKIIAIKTNNDKDKEKQITFLTKFPHFCLRLMINLIYLISYTLGIDFELIKVKKYGFGSGVLTNVTKFIIYDGFAPKSDMGNILFLMTLNSPVITPGFVDGQFVPQKIIKANILIDQRYTEGVDYKILQKQIEEVWYNPELFL